MKYRKKPVVIEAVQFTGRNHEEVRAFCPIARYPILSATGGDDPPVTIPTLEGDMVAQTGDWIIRGVKGECYPCKPDIFELTYEDAEVCRSLPAAEQAVVEAAMEWVKAPWTGIAGSRERLILACAALAKLRQGEGA